ncbi:MAG TPA: vitamin K epoxide reductase family protein [Chthoniobacterales bacterium]|nr:vitamin K epoxide reductase family protein [Chthoniobacterales bacterium]
MKTDRMEKSRTGRSRAEIIFYIAAAVVALIGLTEATYLTVIFLSGETAVCGNSPDCFKVLGSSYAKIGSFPVSGLGALAYFSVFTFATFAAFDYGRVRKFFAWTVLAMFAVTLWLLFVQAFRLHAFCKYCLFSAALVFLLTGLVVARPASIQRSS